MQEGIAMNCLKQFILIEHTHVFEIELDIVL